MPLYPVDLDDRFFLCSPPDQRPPVYLAGGECVELSNVTPDGQLAFVLPKIALRFETEFRGRASVTHRAQLHTVLVEPDVPRVVMVWRTALAAHADAVRLEQTTISQLRVVNAPPAAIPHGTEMAWDGSE